MAGIARILPARLRRLLKVIHQNAVSEMPRKHPLLLRYACLDPKREQNGIKSHHGCREGFQKKDCPGNSDSGAFEFQMTYY